MTKPLSLDEELAAALVESTKELFLKSFSLTVIPKKWSIIETPLEGEYCGIVKLVDCEHRNNVATMGISFTDQAIRYILYNLYGQNVYEKNSETHEMLKDGVGEIANIIYASFKSKLGEKGYSFIMSLPTITEKKDPVIKKNNSNKSLRIPFVTDDCEFFVEASIDNNSVDIKPSRWKDKQKHKK